MEEGFNFYGAGERGVSRKPPPPHPFPPKNLGNNVTYSTTLFFKDS